MTVGWTSPALRSSPSRLLLRRIALEAHVHTRGDPPMFAKANKAYEAKPPPGRSSDLAKKFLPSAGPSAPVPDIRDQLKGPASKPLIAGRLTTTTTTTTTTMRMPTTPVDAKGSLQSLYTSSDSFKKDAAFVDLTVPSPPARDKIKEEVCFYEGDFDDDDDLDLDFEAPSIYPSLPTRQREAKENMPPTSQTETQIPWSSSPASHMLPLKAQCSAIKSGPSTSDSPSTIMPPPKSLLKRGTPEFNDASLDAPAPKKAKKRVLPADFRVKEPINVIDDDDDDALHAPAAKRKQMWEASVSTINEQKRQFRTQRSQDASAPNEVPPTIGKSHNTSRNDAISLSNEQEHVLDLVVNQGKSVFFTGPAGTGKSVLMRAIINKLKTKYARDPERVAVTASTGLAACNIGGITLHSFSGIGLGKEDAGTLVKKIRRNPKAKNRWLRTKCLILDEISMVDGDLFDKLSQIGRTIRNNGRPWGGIQLILTGDFFQLPPVPDAQKRDVKFAFEAATWGTSIDHTIGLTQVFRQRDADFARMLNEIRLGQISQATVEAFKALDRPLRFDDGVESAELYPTRAQVDGSNERRLKDLPGKVHRYESRDTGDQTLRDKLLANMMAPKSLDLKINSQVMLIKNLDESLVNGTLGKVIGFSDEKTFDMTSADSFDPEMDDAMAKARKKLSAFSHDADGGGASGSQKFPIVQFIATDGVPRVILCQPEEWKVELPSGEVQATRTQLPLILAWALSIHKAQGQTLERVTVNLGRVFEKGQAYVALSRATCQQGLRVVGFDKSKVMAHPRVSIFYKQLYSAEEASSRKPASISDFIADKRGSAAAKKVREDVIDLDEEEAMAAFGY